jgi:hypothetical protein
MDDATLFAAIGHSDLSVIQLPNLTHYITCTCGIYFQTYQLHREAVEAAISHRALAVKRFREEASRAGLTLEDALARWNGRARNPANGKLR